ncbi:hypothetical protein KY290_025321 [Solanum tuberosum]|uniref:Uncharacterized protein n=2 Tax=Solanum TaxID=4107 RepID=A0ABQ7UTB2_SOLTU|nr:vascular-related unknown protein 1-like [Solanum stenotomum]KAH0755051.1 hypothetical protein KY290_025321 [Solanum tuberosum]
MDLGPNNSCVNNNIEMETNYDDVDHAPEESGWTTYLEDFSMKQRENNYSSSSDHDNNSFGSPSLLSDAASHAAWKQNSQSPMSGSPFLKRLNLKKQKRNNKISDPDLEDTASSPVNSPKVSNFKQMDINYRTENSSGQFQEMKRVERNNKSFDGKDNNGYIELKKKGLCLVPWSMIVNNHG